MKNQNNNIYANIRRSQPKLQKLIEKNGILRENKKMQKNLKSIKPLKTKNDEMCAEL